MALKKKNLYLDDQNVYKIILRINNNNKLNIFLKYFICYNNK